MKSILKSIIFSSLLVFAQQVTFAQDADKTVTLVVSGQGKSQDEAKQKALRSAIEQAFGAFISSKTEILNDNLVKDEIVSVANGNIQKFEIISEVQIPNGGYATSLKATVSVTKLTSFVESKGVVVEFKGSLFAFNVNQQILNEKNEIKAIEDLCHVITKLSDASFEYSIKVSDPIAVNGSSEKWRIPMYISVSANNNLLNIATYINQTLKGLSLSIEDANNYIKLGKKIYPISFAANESQYNYFAFRTENAVKKIISQVYYFNHSILNFKISNGISDWRINDYPNNLKYIYDYGFRIIIRKGNNGSRDVYCKSGVFHAPIKNINFYLKEDWGKELEFKYKSYDGDYILDHSKWKDESEGGSNYSYGDNSNPNWTIESFQTEIIQLIDNHGNQYKTDIFFEDQFAFVKKFNNIINTQSGVIISFIGIKPQNEIVRFYYEDIKSLEEINKISEYKVTPIDN